MKRIHRVQNLAKKEEGAVIKRIFWLSLFSVILVAVVFTIGLSFLGGFADILESIFKGENSEQTDNSNNTVPPPIIDELPSVTNEQRISITGFSGNATKVEIYLDSTKVDEVDPIYGRFEFKEFHLSGGENIISLKSLNSAGESSDFSKKVIINFDKDPPRLEITSPSDGQHFSGNNRVKITGKSAEEAQVFAQGFLANVDSSGEFEVTVSLELEGENIVEVKAVDEAGNEEKIELKLHFNK